MFRQRRENFVMVCADAASLAIADDGILVSWERLRGTRTILRGVWLKGRRWFHRRRNYVRAVQLDAKRRREADILAKDATGAIKSARSEGGTVLLRTAGDGGLNWIAIYGDGIIEVYSFNLASMKAVAYNTVGNALVAKMVYL